MTGGSSSATRQKPSSAPTCFAYSSARTRFGLIFRSRLPPPTEKTNTMSRDDRRLVFSHSTKTELGADLFRVLERAHQVRADIPLEAAAADGEDKHHVAR